MSGWIEVDPFGDGPPEYPIFIAGSRQTISPYYDIGVGHTAFDYYDALYWMPVPAILEKPRITNDEYIRLVVNER